MQNFMILITVLHIILKIIFSTVFQISLSKCIKWDFFCCFVTNSKHCVPAIKIFSTSITLMIIVCNDNWLITCIFLYIYIILSSMIQNRTYVNLNIIWLHQSFLNALKKTPFWLCIMIDSFYFPIFFSQIMTPLLYTALKMTLNKKKKITFQNF